MPTATASALRVVAVASLAITYEADVVANIADVHITHSATAVVLQTIMPLC